jgi:4-hydroxy-3-methylbut-2-enyl diphosphate reductase
MIESVQDITIDMLKNTTVAAISSGASTPTYLTNQVLSYLEQFDIDNPNTYHTPSIDIEKIL